MYPIDRRKLAVHVYSLFLSLRKTGCILQVSHSTVSRWIRQPERKPYCRSKVSKSSVIVDTIRTSLQNDPFLTIRKLSKIVEEVNNFAVSRELVRTAIQRIKYSNKKARFFSSPKNLEDKTNRFIAQRDAFVAQDRPFVSVDETSFGRHGKDSRGYCPKGQQLRIVRNMARRTTVSSLAAISNTAIVARKETVGSFNTASFSEFVENLPSPRGTVLLLDNVAFHHSKVVKEVADSKGFELLFTPPYSPWYNPIEGVFSIVKREFYKDKSIDEAFQTVRSSHCSAFFNKSFSTPK